MSWIDNSFFAPESLLDDRGRRIMWAWIFDYDPAVGRIHAIIDAVLARAATRAEFVDAFARGHSAQTRRWLHEAFKDDPKERAAKEKERLFLEMMLKQMINQ